MAGIYIHIPFCRHKCSYCDFVSFPDKIDYAEAYMACLYKELKMRGKELQDYTFDTVYFGGGTPSYIPPKLILGAMNQIRKCFTLSKDAEVTLELNPGTIGESKVKIYKEAGINRYSIGLQTAIDEQLADIGRIHNVRDYVYATKLLKGENFSTDVMLGLKNQSKEDIGKTIELAAACGSKHISMYALTVEDGTPIYTDYLNGELPDSDEVADMYDFGRALLKKFGFERYEISNFAKPGYECRHNIGYWKRVDYLGVGLGASSLIDNVRYSNTRDLYTYLSECENIHDCYMQYPLTEGVTGSAVYSADGTHILVPAVNLHAAAEQTTRNEQMEEFMFLGLRMRDGFYREEFTQAFGIPIEAVYGDALNHLQQEELLLKREGRIYLTDKGMDLNNYVVAQFML